MSELIVLPVGGDLHLRFGKDRIVYAGMPSDGVFSIVQRKASGYQGYAWGLFYPRGKQDITIDGVRLFVEQVTPDEITLRKE